MRPAARSGVMRLLLLLRLLLCCTFEHYLVSAAAPRGAAPPPAVDGYPPTTAELLRADQAAFGAKLAVVCQDGDVSSVRDLLGSGAAPDAVGADGLTPLMYASSHGQVGVMRVLPEKSHRVDVNRGDLKQGRTSLMFAAEGGFSDAVAILLAAGAKVRLADQSGYTALSMGAHSGDLATVKALLEHGADKNTRDKFGYPPMSMALKHGHLEVAALISNYDGKNRSDL